MAKSFGSQLNLNRIPVLGLVAESRSTAPTTPVAGQFWYDTSVSRLKWYNGAAWVLADASDFIPLTQRGAANGVATLDGTTKLPIAQIPTSATSSATAVPLANDARLSDNRTPIDDSVSGGPTATGVKIKAGTITHDNVNAANKDGVAGTPSMRTLGTGAQQALPGTTRLDQLSAPTGPVALNGQRVTGLGAPVANDDAARLLDVQSAAAGIDSKPSVRVATTANIALTGTQTIDGIAVTVGQRVLVKNQTTASQNGVYLVAAGAWARDTDTITPNSTWFVEEGTTQQDTAWWVTNDGVVTVGTTALVISQFAGPAGISGTANRVTVTGSVIDISSNYVGQASITTVGTIASGTWQGTAVAVANGGTGAATPAAARTNLGAVGKYAADLGALTAGAETTITHSLNTLDVHVSFTTTADKAAYDLAWRVIDANTVGVTADVASTNGAVRAVVIG